VSWCRHFGARQSKSSLEQTGPRRRSFQAGSGSIGKPLGANRGNHPRDPDSDGECFPYGIVFGRDNNMWFAESQKGKIGSSNLAGTIITSTPSDSAASPRDHRRPG